MLIEIMIVLCYRLLLREKRVKMNFHLMLISMTPILLKNLRKQVSQGRQRLE